MNTTAFTKFVLSCKEFPIEDNIIICSEARGGSTWLMEIINDAVQASILWEPLQVDHGVVPKELNLGWRPYLPENNHDINYVDLFNKILAGKLQNRWTLSYTNILSALLANKLLIKFVRANLLLPWMVKNFKFNHKPILLVRNPIAVAKSQIDSFYKKDPFKIFEIPNSLNNERYIYHYDFLKSLKTPLEQRVALWCIHNVDTINHPLNDKEWITVYYEDLLINPEDELLKLFPKLNLDINSINTAKIRKASKSDFNKKFNTKPVDQLMKWYKKVNMDEKNKVQNIYDYFNFKLYSSNEFLPQKPTVTNSLELN